MRYAILSDIHSNYEALKEVLKYIEKNNISNIIICGDIIGYGPQPIECIDAVMSLGEKARVVLGNHDAVIVGKMDLKWFNDYARKSIELTQNYIKRDHLVWFTNIQEKIVTKDFLIVHGSPKYPLKEYLLSEMQYLDNLKETDNKVVFLGHTHIPMYFYIDDNEKPVGDFIKPFAKVKINPQRKFFINPGSVGQPRDGNSMASFGVFDDEKMIFELIRLNYDIKKVQKLMDEMGMPQLLIERLDMGY